MNQFGTFAGSAQNGSSRFQSRQSENASGCISRLKQLAVVETRLLQGQGQSLRVLVVHKGGGRGKEECFSELLVQCPPLLLPRWVANLTAFAGAASHLELFVQVGITREGHFMYTQLWG